MSQDLITGYYPLPSSITCHVGDGWTHHCSYGFLFYPRPTPSITFRVHVFFWMVSIHLPLNLFTSIHALLPILLGLLRLYLVQLHLAGFTQTKKTRCRMRNFGSWLSKGSQNTLLRAPPQPPSENLAVLILECTPHCPTWSPSHTGTFTWHTCSPPGQPSWSIATPGWFPWLIVIYFFPEGQTLFSSGCLDGPWLRKIDLGNTQN